MSDHYTSRSLRAFVLGHAGGDPVRADAVLSALLDERPIRAIARDICEAPSTVAGWVQTARAALAAAIESGAITETELAA